MKHKIIIINGPNLNLLGEREKEKYGRTTIKQIEKKDIPFALNPLIYDVHGIYLKEKQGISWERIKQYIHEIEPKKLCFALNNL